MGRASGVGSLVRGDDCLIRPRSIRRELRLVSSGWFARSLRLRTGMNALGTDAACDVDDVGCFRPSVPEVDMVSDTSPLRSSSHVLTDRAASKHSVRRVSLFKV